MKVPAILKDKKVLIGGAAALVLIGGYVFLKNRAAPASADSGNGVDDLGSYYSFPTTLGGTTAGTDTSTDGASLSDILNYSQNQAQLSANQNFAAIASQFEQNLASILTSSGNKSIAGAAGNFTIGGTPISFDLTFKDAKAAITTPPVQSPTSTATASNHTA